MKLRLNFFVIFFVIFYSQKWPSSVSTVHWQTTFVCLSAQIKVIYQRTSIVCSDEAAVSVTDTLWFSAVVQFSTCWEHTTKKNTTKKTCVLSVLIFTDFVAAGGGGGGVNNEVTRSVKGKEREREVKREESKKSHHQLWYYYYYHCKHRFSALCPVKWSERGKCTLVFVCCVSSSTLLKQTQSLDHSRFAASPPCTPLHSLEQQQKRRCY